MLKEFLQNIDTTHIDAIRFYGGLLLIGVLLILLAELRRLRTQGEKISHSEINRDLMGEQFREKVFLDNYQWKEYLKLRSIAIEKNLIICPNVHVLRLAEPRDFKVKNRKLRRRLSEQYIDFVICNQNMKVLALIRLLKQSEVEGPEDLFNRYANAVLGTLNYKIINTWTITPDILDFIK